MFSLRRIMKQRKFIKLNSAFAFLGGVLLSACMQSEYTRLVKSELAKGVRYDSILLGINFGVSHDQFREKCFELNRQHLVTEGEGFGVQYFFHDSLFHIKPTKIQLVFSPEFDDQSKLCSISMKFSYPSWAPWNPKTLSDSLKPKVIKIVESWYRGNAFIKASVQGQEIPVKLDGNRRIVIEIKDSRNVVANVQDILNPRYQHKFD